MNHRRYWTGHFLGLVLVLGTFFILGAFTLRNAAAKPAVVPASTLAVFYADQDVMVAKLDPTTNYDGSDLGVTCDLDAFFMPNDIAYTYVQFDIDSLPADKSITRATLFLYLTTGSAVVGAPPGVGIDVYSVTSPWMEGLLTWDTQPSSGEHIASTSLTLPLTNTVLSWDVTNAVQTWYEGSAFNFGFVLKNSGCYFTTAFKSSETSLLLSQQPRLYVWYDDVPTATPTPTVIPTPTRTPTPTNAPTATFTPTPPPGTTVTPTPSSTNTPTVTPLSTSTPTSAPTPTPTRLPAVTPRPDLGDAPDSTNRAGLGMTAYDGVPAHFPTTFGSGAPPHGPLHRNTRVILLLGYNLTAEKDADSGSDADGSPNIRPADDVADGDGGDDGVLLPSFFRHCRPTSVEVVISVYETLPGPVYLNLWADWNRNGRWGDVLTCNGQLTAEWAVRNQVLTLSTPGVYRLHTSVFLPYNTRPEMPMWLRVTVSQKQAQRADGSGPSTGWGFGETEDYLMPGVYRHGFPLIVVH